ncbi:hypothetical protein [Vibrio parahaemolyticus]|uniref:hypothetical protein n=1 Tax=Vibrio parahaemolyticus TaxID=670 RepID=UPI003D81716D
MQTYEDTRFEDRLSNYMKAFQEQLDNIQQPEDCSCCKSTFKDHEDLIKLEKERTDFYQSLNEQFGRSFSLIRTLYNKTLHSMYDEALGDILEVLLPLAQSNSEEPFSDLSRSVEPLFRARPKGNYTASNRELLHIPFSKRHLVTSQRYSMIGVPMLYTGSSLEVLEKELSLPSSKLNHCILLPKSRMNMLDLSSKWQRDFINDIHLKAAMRSYSKFESKGPDLYVPDPQRLEDYVLNIALREVLSFPVMIPTASFIPEYVLPQLVTLAAKKSGFDGIVFDSTKDYSDLARYGMQGDNYNKVFFTEYSATSCFDDELLNRFHVYTNTGREITPEYFVGLMLKIEDEQRKRLKSSIPAVLEEQINCIRGRFSNLFEYENPYNRDELRVNSQLGRVEVELLTFANECMLNELNNHG